MSAESERFSAMVRPILQVAHVRHFTRPRSCDPNLEIDLAVDARWAYDDIAKLAAVLGTTDIRFRWDTEPGYSEYTPGGLGSVTIEVRWQEPAAKVES